MDVSEAIRFLRRKLDLIVENTWSEENEQILRDFWTGRLAALDPATAKLPALRAVDLSLEKNFKAFVLREDQKRLRDQLIQEFALARLTPAAIKTATAGPLPPDHVVFTPSGGRPLPATRDRSGLTEYELLEVSAATLGELAQFYARYSGKEVRVPAALASRATRGARGQCQPDYILQSLTGHLSMERIEVANKSGGIVVLRDIAPELEAKWQAMTPLRATQDEITRAESSMSVAQFWKLLERAANAGGGKCQATAEALETALMRLSPDEILGFELRKETCMAESYRWDLWAVAYLMNGGCSDDGFEYFRGWLLTQGSDYFEAALRDPERAADRALGQDNHECEAILYPAREVYTRKTKRPMPFALAPRPLHPVGKSWEEEELPALYPRLAARFG